MIVCASPSKKYININMVLFSSWSQTIFNIEKKISDIFMTKDDFNVKTKTVSVLYNRFSLITFRMLISFKLILAYQFLICWILIAAYKFWIQVQTRETTSNYSFDVSTCTTLKPYFSIVKHQLLCKFFLNIFFVIKWAVTLWYRRPSMPLLLLCSSS